MDWTSPIVQASATLGAVGVLALLVWWSERQLTRRVERVVSTVARDGFFEDRHVEIYMRGHPHVFEVHYFRQRDRSGWPRRAIVHGVDQLRTELWTHLGS